METISRSDLETSFTEQVTGDRKDDGWIDSEELVEGHVVCVICMENILIQETALIKGSALPIPNDDGVDAFVPASATDSDGVCYFLYTKKIHACYH
ncbi:hypothetical protein KSP40_PGU011482 [Platanthera guangdongensis]|uniref:Recombination activating protein 2 n=1 Tax=Platanthera guangdongensis TaxID=2320717 RepID=A0ABR2M8Q2_9ASPA